MTAIARPDRFPRNRLRGAMTALVTPFAGDRVDEAALKALVERQIAEGIDGLVPVGTTGETPTLTIEEHHRVIELVVETVAGRVPVVAGCGSNDTRTTIEHMKVAKACGADAALVVAPYYNKPSQAGLVAHFHAAADAVELPIVVYNIPGRSVVDIQPATLARIAEHPNIVGLKDSAGDPSRTALHRAMIEKDFSILAGDDYLALGFGAYGADGLVSVLSNVLPAQAARLQALMAAGDFVAARVLNETLDPLSRALFVEPNPGPCKAALRMMGLCSDDVRLPLVPAGEDTRAALRAALAKAGGPVA